LPLQVLFVLVTDGISVFSDGRGKRRGEVYEVRVNDCSAREDSHTHDRSVKFFICTHRKTYFDGPRFAETIFVAIAFPVNHVLINSSSARMFPSTR
jgi:hypothetical protein